MYPLVVVEARAIGVMHMRDEKGNDHKVIAVNIHDPLVADYTDHGQLPAHLLKEIRRFFEDYKTLEHKQVVVDALLGPDAALEVICKSMEFYRRTVGSGH